MRDSNKSLLSITGNVSKVATTIDGFLGTLADIFLPLAPFAPILFGVSLVLFFTFSS